MRDVMAEIRRLNRPRLLVASAKAGLADWNRARGLPRVLRTVDLPPDGQALGRLLDHEATWEAARQAAAATYSARAHVEVLIALLAEARLVQSPALVPAGAA
jgi:hypothetical protein